MHNKLVTHFGSLIPITLPMVSGRMVDQVVTSLERRWASTAWEVRLVGYSRSYQGRNEVRVLVFSVKVKGKIHDSGPRRRPGIQLVDHRTTP